ncbi:hypothetical protein BKM09_015355 [Pseudomonas amygdali pv. morsprunorum]|nr:hypothetical protein BKM19_003275 [Pseudomonas amygdali pv. morsprunorum]KAA3535813.1 hypothetical protein DXU85_24105 [Pseudomonas savastanoi]POP89318.1 hypothetical protein CXB39_27420 [Pseudomonas amygdali pv. morsprunorum]POY79997.1 hypothetical protein BKM09_015355 [Pseudomonas amygdali pv. morsprunorum]TSC33384.1 hypothetical protein FOM00_24655 [Pseudomonas sp. ST1]
MHFQRIYRPFRGQVRSHGLRPESRADLCITPSILRGNAVLDALRPFDNQIRRCAAPACRSGNRSVPSGNSFLRKVPSS